MMMTMNNDELQYLNLVKDVIETGYYRPGASDRTGVGTYVCHGKTMRFNLQDGIIPLLTTKRIPFKAVLNELIWFLSGETNIQPLVKKNVHIWSDWPHAKYVKETGHNISMEEFERLILNDDKFAKKWGDLGPVYGKQWRRWQGYDGKVYDQISSLIKMLKVNPDSRRALFHGWNVSELEEMALPPCHLLYQFFVTPQKDSEKRRLSLTLYQRSCDVGLGVPFNIASASVLVHMFAQQLDMDAGELFWVGHDVHIYENHIDALKQQLDRQPREFPKIKFARKPYSIFQYNDEDIILKNYNPYPIIKMDVAV